MIEHASTQASKQKRSQTCKLEAEKTDEETRKRPNKCQTRKPNNTQNHNTTPHAQHAITQRSNPAQLSRFDELLQLLGSTHFRHTTAPSWTSNRISETIRKQQVHPFWLAFKTCFCWAIQYPKGNQMFVPYRSHADPFSTTLLCLVLTCQI